jgi:hypothetical protein
MNSLSMQLSGFGLTCIKTAQTFPALFIIHLK